MSRHLPQKQGDRLPPFVPLEKNLLRSEAWQDLSHPARVAFVHLKLQICHKYQTSVVLTYDAMEPIMHRRTFAKAIRQLEEVGLIHREQYGGLYRVKNVFSFSQAWKRYETKRIQKSKGQVAKVPLLQVAKVPLSDVKELVSDGKSATCSEHFDQCSSGKSATLYRHLPGM